MSEGVGDVTDSGAVMSALSQKIADFISQQQPPPLPADVQRRVHALKNLQVDFLKVESEFYKEVQLLEVKYMQQYQPILEKRRKIVTGEYEPTDEECQWTEETEDKEEGGASSSPATGIPEFWLTAMKNTDIFSDWIKEHDEPALQHLTDILVVYPNKTGLEFSLEFHFSENEWFSNKVLAKSYQMACEVEDDDPFSFEGAAITSCEGCSIDWKKGKNLTVKTIKKKQKHKGAGQARVITKTVPNESFFTFFSPPKLEDEEKDEEVSQLLSDDFARAEFIRDRLVAKAVLFFTGEIADDEDDFGVGDEEEEEEDDDEEGGEDGDLKQQVAQAKPECKQQYHDSTTDRASVRAVPEVAHAVRADCGGPVFSTSEYRHPAECRSDAATAPSIAGRRANHPTALALGRLANHSGDLAEAVVKGDILPQLVTSLADQNRFYKKAAAFVLRAVARHSPELAQAVVDSGALDALAVCMEEFDPGVKEASAWALGYIARHSADLSLAVVDSGCVPLLVLAVQEPEIDLKRISASALSDISKHSPELAQTVVDAGAIPHLTKNISSSDHKLKRQVLSALSQISKHSLSLAEMVVEAEVFPALLGELKDSDEYVRKNAATLTREIARHTPELAQLVVNSGGLAALVEYTGASSGSSSLPAIMTLGYIGAHSEALGMAVIASKAVIQLAISLTEETENHVLAAVCWALGQVGRHTTEHAKAVAGANVLPRLLELHLATTSSEDLQMKSKRALKNILTHCTHLPALEPLLHSAPPNILKHVVGQFSKVLPHDPKARRLFVTSGGLKKVQDISCQTGSVLAEHIRTINNCYPEEIVRYYSPGYSDTLLDKVEQYRPHPLIQ